MSWHFSLLGEGQLYYSWFGEGQLDSRIWASHILQQMQMRVCSSTSEMILREVRLILVFRKCGVERLGLDTELQRREMGLNDYRLTFWLLAFYDNQHRTAVRILFWFCNHRQGDKKIAWHSALSSQCSTKGFLRTNKLPKLPHAECRVRLWQAPIRINSWEEIYCFPSAVTVCVVPCNDRGRACIWLILSL